MNAQPIPIGRVFAAVIALILTTRPARPGTQGAVTTGPYAADTTVRAVTTRRMGRPDDTPTHLNFWRPEPVERHRFLWVIWAALAAPARFMVCRSWVTNAGNIIAIRSRPGATRSWCATTGSNTRATGQSVVRRLPRRSGPAVDRGRRRIDRRSGRRGADGDVERLSSRPRRQRGSRRRHPAARFAAAAGSARQCGRKARRGGRPSAAETASQGGRPCLLGPDPGAGGIGRPDPGDDRVDVELRDGSRRDRRRHGRIRHTDQRLRATAANSFRIERDRGRQQRQVETADGGR